MICYAVIKAEISYRDTPLELAPPVKRQKGRELP